MQQIELSKELARLLYVIVQDQQSIHEQKILLSKLKDISIHQIINRIDAHKSNQIRFDDFYHFIITNIDYQLNELQIRKLFNHIDILEDGVITRKELEVYLEIDEKESIQSIRKHYSPADSLLNKKIDIELIKLFILQLENIQSVWKQKKKLKANKNYSLNNCFSQIDILDLGYFNKNQLQRFLNTNLIYFGDKEFNYFYKMFNKTGRYQNIHKQQFEQQILSIYSPKTKNKLQIKRARDLSQNQKKTFQTQMFDNLKTLQKKMVLNLLVNVIQSQKNIEEQKLKLFREHGFNLLDSFRLFDRSRLNMVYEVQFIDVLKQMKVKASEQQFSLLYCRMKAQNRNYLEFQDYVNNYMQFIIDKQQNQVYLNRIPSYMKQIFENSVQKLFVDFIEKCVEQEQAIYETIKQYNQKLKIMKPENIFKWIDKENKQLIGQDQLYRFMFDNYEVIEKTFTKQEMGLLVYRINGKQEPDDKVTLSQLKSFLEQE